MADQLELELLDEYRKLFGGARAAQVGYDAARQPATPADLAASEREYFGMAPESPDVADVQRTPTDAITDDAKRRRMLGVPLRGPTGRTAMGGIPGDYPKTVEFVDFRRRDFTPHKVTPPEDLNQLGLSYPSRDRIDATPGFRPPAPTPAAPDFGPIEQPRQMDPRVQEYLRGQAAVPSRYAALLASQQEPEPQPEPLPPPRQPQYGPPVGLPEPPVLGQAQEPEEPYDAAAPKAFDAGEHTPEAEEKRRAKRMRKAAKEEAAREAQAKEALDALAADKAERERQQQIDKTERWKGVTEGLGKLGAGIAGLRGHLPPEAFAQPSTDAIDRELAKLDDVMSPEEQKMLEAAFGKGSFPRGIRRSTFRATLPAISGYLAAKQRSASQEAVAKAREKAAMTAQGAKIASEEKMAAASIASREKIAGMKPAKTAAPRLIPGTGVVELSNLKDMGKSIEDVRRLYDKAKDKVGPITSRWASTIRKLAGTGDPDLTRLDKAIQQLVAKYVYATTGKQASDSERQDRKAEAMKIIDDAPTFEAGADTLYDNMKRKHNTLLETYQGAGYSGGELKPMSGFARYRVGKDTFRIPDADRAAFEADNKGAELLEE